MSLTPATAKARIARELKEAEARVDAAISAVSTLTATLVAARGLTGLEPHTGQDSLVRLTRTQTALVGASTNVLRVHESIARIGVEVGIMEEGDATKPMGVVDEVDSAIAA